MLNKEKIRFKYYVKNKAQKIRLKYDVKNKVQKKTQILREKQGAKNKS